jgi:uncharacterized protein YodC (DUF2158 family)
MLFIEGTGYWIFDSGETYEGGYSNEKWNGFGKYTYDSGEIYEGEWENGEKHGKGKYTHTNGDVYEGGFMNGKRHGFYEYRWANGAVETGNLEEGKEHGRIWFDADGDGQGYALQYEYGQRVFRVGRRVRLKSGGQIMTISEVNKKTITCQYISYGNLESLPINEDLLKIIE